MVVRAIIKEDRYGNKVYICPLCGHVFYSPKQFQKHLMRSHLYKRHRKKRIEKKIGKRGYIRRMSFGKPKAPKIEKEEKIAKVTKAETKPIEAKPAPKVPETKKVERVEKVEDEELLKAVEKFIENRAKGKKKKTIRFKITTLARELNIDVDKARELVSKVPNASIKGDWVTVKLE